MLKINEKIRKEQIFLLNGDEIQPQTFICHDQANIDWAR